MFSFFFFQAEDGIRDVAVTGVQTCALPISLRGLGASLSLDRSKNPCPCFLLRAGPDSGWAVAPRSPPRRPGAQSRRPLSGTLFDLRNHQSLSLDFEEEGGPSSRLHHVH